MLEKGRELHCGYLRNLIKNFLVSQHERNCHARVKDKLKWNISKQSANNIKHVIHIHLTSEHIKRDKK